MDASKEPRARLLVIDDEPFIINAVRRALREHEVFSATSAGEAIEMLKTQSFDLVFCDLMMPEVSGMDLYDRLCTERPGLEERLVFMTGGAFTARARDFLERISNPRFEKPFDL